MLSILLMSGPGQRRLIPQLCYLPHAFAAAGSPLSVLFPAESLPALLAAEALPATHAMDALAGVVFPQDALPVVQPEAL